MLFKRLLLVLLLVCGPVFADMVAKGPNGELVRLSKAECPAEIAKLIPAPLQEKFAKAVAVIGGKQYKACWTPTPNGVLLQYEDGDQGLVPFEVFKPDEGI